MEILILLVCVPVGMLIYFCIVRPLLIPLTQRIPTGREYRATLSARRS